MRYFFTKLQFIKLVDFDNESLEIIPGIKITNSKEIINKLLTDKNKHLIGFLESINLSQADTILYYEYPSREEIWEDLKHLQILELFLNWIDNLLKNSWLHKDNCIVIDSAFLIDDFNENTQISSLRLHYKHSLSTGGIDTVTYTKKEILELSKIHDKVESYLSNRDSLSMNFMLEKNFSRIGRALLFVKQGRECRNIAYKLSNYCSALETLFTTNNMEISHKLSERAAFFLQERFEKKETFSTIKKAYAVRSKLTHGDSLDNNQIKNIFIIAEQTDNILRECFIKIFNDDNLVELFDSNNQRIEDLFIKLILE